MRRGHKRMFGTCEEKRRLWVITKEEIQRRCNEGEEKTLGKWFMSGRPLEEGQEN